MHISVRTVFAAVFMCFGLLSCTKGGETRLDEARNEWVFGTLCRFSLPKGSDPGIYRELGDRLRGIEAIMSANWNDSQLEAVNRAAGISAVVVDPELFAIVEQSLALARASGGAFDPTIGPLVKLWGIGSDEARVPTEEERTRVMALCGIDDVIMNAEAGTIALARTGMRLDLGAIAKGYAADELSKLLDSRGVPYAVIDLGGNVFCHGRKPDGAPWRVGVQDPMSSRGGYLGIIEIESGAVVTSGVYERFFEQDGVRYHHLLDASTGAPARNGLASVTIVSSSAQLADALATALFVAGPEEGYRLIALQPQAEAVFVLEDGTVRVSPGLKGRFTLRPGDWRLID